MRCVLAALTLIGCGRVAFDARTDASRTDVAVIADAPDPDDVLLADAGLPAGLIAHFEFEDLVDSVSGVPALCAATQCPAMTAGHTQMGVLFDGANDCLVAADDGRYEPPTLTIALWARQDAAGTMSHVAKRVIGGTVNSWQIETDPVGGDPNTVSFTTYDGSGLNVYAITADNTITIGQWHHIAVTFDGSVKRVFIDGAESTFVTGHPALSYDGMSVTIGCDDNAPYARFFLGVLDDLQFYNRALSAAEIASLAI